MRPVPVVLRLFAFMPQLYDRIFAEGYPHDAHAAQTGEQPRPEGGGDALLCWRWKARLPHRRQRVCDFVCRLLWVRGEGMHGECTVHAPE